MIRKPSVLAIAFVAMSVAASAAQAETVHFQAGNGEGTAKITAEQDPTAPTQLLRTKAGNISCEKLHATYEGAATTKEATLENIEYGECTLGGLAASVNFNAGTTPCHYTISAGETAETGKSTGGVTLGPKGCKVEITSALARCNVSVEPQEFPSSITYTSVKTTEKEEEITGHATAKNIHYHTLNATCPGGGAGEGTEGEYTGTFTARAFTTGGGQENLALVS